MRETRIGLRSVGRAFSDGHDCAARIEAGCAKRRFVICALLLLSLILNSASGQSQEQSEAARKSSGAFLFAYFKGNGEDGLHFAHSDDGLVWRPVNNGQPVVKPAVGRDKLMRDPHITVGQRGRSTWSGHLRGRSR